MVQARVPLYAVNSVSLAQTDKNPAAYASRLTIW
jgi:hypothetical protein